jgi:hypothetical protein
MLTPLDNVDLEPKAPSTPNTPSRKRKRSMSSRSPSTGAAIPNYISMSNEELNVSSPKTESPTDVEAKNQSPHLGILLSVADKVVNVAPDTLGSSSPRTVAARQLSYLAIEEGVVDRVPDSSDATAFKTLSRPSSTKSRKEAFEFDANRKLVLPQSEDIATPPAKRMPPPCGIKSPRPRFRSSPYSPPRTSPEEANQALEENDSGYDAQSLTWQDSEITGHLLLDPDDDGEGLNGIGFRPTPALAFERSERRKRQVSEWKSRQAREEREKRAVRRRRAQAMFGNVDMQGQNSLPKKVVRFAI